MNPPKGAWLLVCPANDYRSATQYQGPEAWRAALRTAKQLNAEYTWDENRQKLYIRDSDRDGVEKPEDKAPVPSALSVLYPSGAMAERHPENNDPDYAPAHPSLSTPLVKLSPDIQVSANFRLSEFAPKSAAYDGVRVHPHLVRLLERIREAAGGRVNISSGYRPPRYNAAVGGVDNSHHRDGIAADIWCPHLSTEQLHAVCARVMGATGGLGKYPTKQFCHVDIGPYGRWTG